MRLADDRQGRVPFAIISIVLLLGSATYAATLAARGPADDGPAVVNVREQLTAAVDTTVRTATARAAARAAANPVVEPADTETGRALDPDEPFREYLELRVYLAVRQSLSDLSVRSGTVAGTASLPEPAGPADMISRVEVARGDRNASIDVRVENVTLRLRREGRTVLRKNVTVERTVASPVLALHDRVTKFEQRLGADLTDESGLASRVAAMLYTYAWALGYMQYAGAPVQNVVANRHLAVATNVGLVAVQRATFGRADPAAAASLTPATATMVREDAAGAVPGVEDPYLERALAVRRNRSGVTGSFGGFPTGPSVVPGPSETTTVEVGLVADRALGAFLNGTAEPRALSDVLRATYSAQTRLRVATRTISADPEPARRPPGDGWELASEYTGQRTAIAGGDAPEPAVPDDWHRLDSFTRRVTINRTVVRTWTNGNRTQVNRRSWTEVVAVGIGLDGRHAPTGWTPRNGIATVHERGAGPLDGPNLAGIPETATQKLLEDPGRDALARRAALGELNPETAALLGERPDGLRALVRKDLMEVRREMRNVSTTVTRGAVGSGTANAAKNLSKKVKARRAQLVDAPETYDSVAHKARVAARAAYVDAVIERLERREEQGDRRNRGIEAVLARYGLSPADLRGAMRSDPTMPTSGTPMLEDGIAGPVEVTVAGEPAYLTRAGLTDEQVRSVAPATLFYPLRTKNVNVFTAPYGDAADVVLDSVLGDSDTTSLRAAARTLQAANETLAETDNETLREKRDELRRALSTAVRRSSQRLSSSLVAVNSRFDSVSLSASEREAAVEEALGNWETTADRALAIANGSLAPRVAAAVDRRASLPEGGRGVVAMQMRFELDRATRASTVRPPQALVEDAGRTTRSNIEPAAKRMSEMAFNRTYSRLQKRYDSKYKLVPAGLPVTPLPAYYYAVANLWITQVEGAYASFAVSAGSPAPSSPDTVSYRRNGGRVALDVDADGKRETFGWSRRVGFEFTIPIAVVVPPTPNGLGDRDGNADERSDGWGAASQLLRHNGTAAGSDRGR
ncbi:MAG: hypothetical protein V5A23_08465 [Halobacteriales archaeon]